MYDGMYIYFLFYDKSFTVPRCFFFLNLFLRLPFCCTPRSEKMENPALSVSVEYGGTRSMYTSQFSVAVGVVWKI